MRYVYIILDMRKFIFIVLSAILFMSCMSVPMSSSNGTSNSRGMPSDDRSVLINGIAFVESELGHIERWYAVDKYSLNPEVLFQVVSVDQFENAGYVLYGSSSVGTIAVYTRQGLTLRWDWGDNFEYSIVIEPDGTGYYYDFTNSTDGTARPTGIYQMYRF